MSSSPDTLVVRLPIQIRSKQKLLGILAKRLRFPRYFGGNWDALEECLRDLSWLSAKKIVLQHPALPFSQESENREIYLAVLKSAAEFWRQNANQPGRLTVELPGEKQPQANA